MVPVGGRPFLEHLVGLLRDNGITEIVLLVGYLAEKIITHFGDGSQFGVSIKYSIGTESDLTGTRIRNAASLLADKFLLLYGDNYWPMRLGKMLDFYKSKSAIGTLVAYSNIHGDAEHGSQNNLRIEADGRVTHYGAFSDDPSLNGVDIGFFLMNKQIVRMMPADNFSFEQVILPRLIEQGTLFAYHTDHPYHAITTVAQLPVMAEFLRPKRVIFLDRDGVINRQMPPHDYVKNWAEFEFLPGALEALRLLSQASYQIYIVTNQRGIARGLMTEADLDDIHQRMQAAITAAGGQIADIYYCPHNYDDNCDCRKPKAGMFTRAAREHNLDLSRTLFIGDNESDVVSGRARGAEALIVSSDHNLLATVQQLLSQ